MTAKCPYKYDLIASMTTVGILVASWLLPSGKTKSLKIMGIACLAGAVVLWFLPIFTLKKYGKVNEGQKYFETNAVVKDGIYAIIRHPQYLAYMLLVIGFTLVSQHWLIILLAVITIIFFYLQGVAEEEELRQKFPATYDVYCANTPRFNILRGLLNWIIYRNGL